MHPVHPVHTDNGQACPKCGNLTFVDVPIDNGKTRRDCAKCGRFVSFPKWNEAKPRKFCHRTGNDFSRFGPIEAANDELHRR